MGCHGNDAFRHSQNKFFPGDNFFSMPGVPLNNWIPMESYWGSKVCQIRSQGTCNMILFAGCQRLYFIFHIFFIPNNTLSPKIF